MTITNASRVSIPSRLTDTELIAEVSRCARDEHGATARLVAHLAELDARQLHLAAGYSSLFAYCCEVLGLSEDASCNRIEAARAGRMFPVILERMADGSLNVSTVRLLARHLTAENHQELLAAACRRPRRVVEELIAHRFPKPDTPSSVRKVPERPMRMFVTAPLKPGDPLPRPEAAAAPFAPEPILFSPSPRTDHRPLVKPLATDRYEFRFTGTVAMREKLKVAQDLERHAVSSGDVARVVERALDALIELRSREKLAIVLKPRAKPRPTASGSRHLPAAVKRAVWGRDRSQCAFISPGGHRCTERAFLEFHHVTPYAAGGEATIANIQLRCRAHNGYEAAVHLRGTGGIGAVNERRAKYDGCWQSYPSRDG